MLARRSSPEGAARRVDHRLTLAVLAFAALGYSLLQALTVPALPDIQRSLHASESSVTWVMTAYLLSASVATPIVGRLGDMYGKDRALVVVLVVLGAGTVISALATTMSVLILGRLVQGVGGGIFPLAYGIVRDEFPRERVAGSLGFLSSLLGVGAAVGLVLAGFVVQHLDYHWLFWLPFGMAALSVWATWRWIPPSPVHLPGRVNWLGALLMAAGMSAVLIAITESGTWGAGSGRTLGLFAAGLLLAGAWVVSELRSATPVVDMRMMRLRGVWTTNLVAALFGVGMYASFIVTPMLVQEPVSTGYGFGASVVGAGLYQLPAALGMVITGQLSGRIERRFGSKPPLLAGCALATVAFVMLAAARDRPWEVCVANALLGLALGLAFAAMAHLIVQHVRQEQTGVASGVNTVVRLLGGAIGAQVAASLLTSSLGPAHLPTATAFTLIFAMCAVALVGATAATLLIAGPNARSARARVPILVPVGAPAD
jgi:MFS family permease